MNKVLKLGMFYALIILISGCEKFESLDPKEIVNAEQMVCSGGKVEDSPFTNEVWSDHFKGQTGSKDPATCFTDPKKATCSQRLDWFHLADCRTSVDHLQHLNKCRWTIWEGYSFWEQSNQLAYRPSQVTVDPNANGEGSETGTIKFRFTVRSKDPNQPFKCGPNPDKNIDAGDYYDEDCQIFGGGIDSKYRDNGRTPGRNFKQGRVEIRARFKPQSGTWPALWTWAGNVGPGDPYPFDGHATSAKANKSTTKFNQDYLQVDTMSTLKSGSGDWTGEIDILEVMGAKGTDRFQDASQTYHVWHHGGGNHYTSGAKSMKNDVTKWTTYGVERNGKTMKFYIDGCFTKVIEDGGNDSKNQPTMLIDNATEYLIMSMGLTKEAALSASKELENAEFEIDWVKFYE